MTSNEKWVRAEDVRVGDEIEVENDQGVWDVTVTAKFLSKGRDGAVRIKGDAAMTTRKNWRLYGSYRLLARAER